MENTQPLLSNENHQIPASNFLRQSNHSIESSSFIADAADIPKITGIGVFYTQFIIESKKLWYLAGPAIFTSLCQYSLGAITQTFAGQVGTLDLAAFSVENSVIAGFSFGTLTVGFWKNLGGAINAHGKKIQKEVCRIISNIAATMEGSLSELHTARLTDPLYSLLEKDEDDVKMEAAWAIYNSIYGSKFDPSIALSPRE